MLVLYRQWWRNYIYCYKEELWLLIFCHAEIRVIITTVSYNILQDNKIPRNIAQAAVYTHFKEILGKCLKGYSHPKMLWHMTRTCVITLLSVEFQHTVWVHCQSWEQRDQCPHSSIQVNRAVLYFPVQEADGSVAVKGKNKGATAPN